MEILNLWLETPIFYQIIVNPHVLYKEIQQNLFNEREFLFCFKLNEGQYDNFEAKIEYFPGDLIWGGENIEKNAENNGLLRHSMPAGHFMPVGHFMPAGHSMPVDHCLPAGSYVFTQEREFLDNIGIANFAREMQMEGLWQRYKMEKILYLRYLYEDGKTVSQLFRPIT